MNPDRNSPYTEDVRRKITEANKKRVQSEETKAKISASRIKFLQAHPEMVPYRLNHYSKGSSYAEKYWQEVLEKHGIEFTPQLPISVYTLDFAFEKHKIDLEIDGEQHHVDPRIVKSDERRTQYLESLGWKVIRVRWSRFKQLSEEERKKFVQSILSTS